MTTTSPEEQHEPQSFARLPEPVRLQDTVTTQETHEAPDPALGRDVHTEWLLRHGAG